MENKKKERQETMNKNNNKIQSQFWQLKNQYLIFSVNKQCIIEIMKKKKNNNLNKLILTTILQEENEIPYQEKSKTTKSHGT